MHAPPSTLVLALFLKFVYPCADYVIDLHDRLHLRRPEFPLDRSALLAFLHLYEFVILQSTDALHLPAIYGLLVKLLSKFELDFGIFESAGCLQNVQSVLFRQFDDGTDAATHFARHHTYAERLHELVEILAAEELVTFPEKFARHGARPDVTRGGQRVIKRLATIGLIVN